MWHSKIQLSNLNVEYKVFLMKPIRMGMLFFKERFEHNKPWEISVFIQNVINLSHEKVVCFYVDFSLITWPHDKNLHLVRQFIHQYLTFWYWFSHWMEYSTLSNLIQLYLFPPIIFCPYVGNQSRHFHSNWHHWLFMK